MHLLIPAALADAPALAQALGNHPDANINTNTDAGLALPYLQRLLRVLHPIQQWTADADSPSMPDELALAQALGLPGAAGHIPWAAHDTQTWDTPCAWLRPCHWQVGTDRILMGDPESLALTQHEAQTLCDAMAPYCAEDGISLRCLSPGAWLACGEVFRDLPTASLRRVVGRSIDAWLPDAASPQGATLRRLQNEMQMLLYTHPLNDERGVRGLAPVNSFWLTGAGVLPAPGPAPRPEVVVEPGLQTPALHQDSAAWAQAWRDIDQGRLAALLALARQGQPVRLTLCGELRAFSYASDAPTPGRWARLRTALRPPRLHHILHAS